MALMVAIYGKGGIGKSTISSNLAVALTHRGQKVLQVGCDPKHDSTFPLTGVMQPTVIEILNKHRFHYEEITSQEIFYPGFNGVTAVEAGGPPAGVGCGGYVIGETIQLLNNRDSFKDYDVVIFDILGDIVCGGFSVPLQFAKYVYIVATNDFDSIFAANRIASAVLEKAKTYPVSLAGIIANRCNEHALIDKFAAAINSKVVSVVGNHDIIRRSRLQGKTLFEMVVEDAASKEYLKPFFEIADSLLAEPKPGKITPLQDRQVFELFKEQAA
jgi:light-independent protochlorophyllide reductase subunit L